jgi:hypothetical protein
MSDRTLTAVLMNSPAAWHPQAMMQRSSTSYEEVAGSITQLQEKYSILLDRYARRRWAHRPGTGITP